MDLNALILTVVAVLVGAMAGGAGAVALTRRHAREQLQRSEADQVAAVDELRKQHQAAIKQHQRQQQQVVQGFEREREINREQLREMTREVENARVALAELLRHQAPGGSRAAERAAQALPADPAQAFAATLPMSASMRLDPRQTPAAAAPKP